MTDIYRTNPGSLAKIMNLEEGELHDWQPDELGSMLLHQLSAPIQFDLHSLSGETAKRFMDLIASGTELPNRFDDLFHHPKPPIEMLQFTKQLAKSQRWHPDSPMQKIATVLYYASIVVARLRCNQRITELADDVLKAGVDWVLEQPWIDPRTRALFTEARQAFGKTSK